MDRRVFRYLSPYKARLGGILAISLASTALSLWLPYLTKVLVDDALIARSAPALQQTVWLFLSAGAASFVLGAVSVVLAIVLVRAGLGLAGAPAAAALVWTIRNVFFVSSRSAVLLELRWYAFNGHLAVGLLAMAGVAALGRILCALWWPTGWFSLASFAGVIALAYGAFAYFVLMTKADRALILGAWAVQVVHQHIATAGGGWVGRVVGVLIGRLVAGPLGRERTAAMQVERRSPGTG